MKQHGADAIVITFSVRTCRPCPFREQCTSPRWAGACSPCVPGNRTRPSSGPAPSRRPRPGRPSTPCAQGWRAPSTRPWTSPASAGPATADCRKSASSTPSPQPHST
ncbi:hypothetical protein G6048_24240 [Streptomyces sp. YC419]|uniref:Transposase DDE domain-containing protein n=1 Tax=Streptomyces ureilyticus TaxID=1775131 RepID=A0ABX0DTA5_9ACTN|nr:hypothetical protein [Streptomyces ureilyticus]